MILRDLLSLDDSAHAIALGSAIGMWVGLTPTVGIQITLVVILYYLCKRWLYFNMTAGLLVVMISNPITTPPIYWFDYEVGAWLLDVDENLNFARLLEYDGFSGWWATVCDLAVKAGWPLAIGSLLVATAVSIPTYAAVYLLVQRFRTPIIAPGHQIAKGSAKHTEHTQTADHETDGNAESTVSVDAAHEADPKHRGNDRASRDGDEAERPPETYSKAV